MIVVTCWTVRPGAKGPREPGARGYEHIGVIQALEELGTEIVRVAGASMAALDCRWR
jgi:hypothetical protein